MLRFKLSGSGLIFRNQDGNDSRLGNISGQIRGHKRDAILTISTSQTSLGPQCNRVISGDLPVNKTPLFS